MNSTRIVLACSVPSEIHGRMKNVAAYRKKTLRQTMVDALEDWLSRQSEEDFDYRIKIDDIVSAVADHYGIDQERVSSGSRVRDVVFCRQVAMFLSRSLTPHSFQVISRKFGDCNHATVIHGVRRIESLMQGDVKLKEEVNALATTLKRAVSS